MHNDSAWRQNSAYTEKAVYNIEFRVSRPAWNEWPPPSSMYCWQTLHQREYKGSVFVLVLSYLSSLLNILFIAHLPCLHEPLAWIVRKTCCSRAAVLRFFLNRYNSYKKNNQIFLTVVFKASTKRLPLLMNMCKKRISEIQIIQVLAWFNVNHLFFFFVAFCIICFFLLIKILKNFYCLISCRVFG
jgi:hypothetical protein